MSRKKNASKRTNNSDTTSRISWQIVFVSGLVIGAGLMYATAPLLPPATVIPKIADTAAELSTKDNLPNLEFTFYKDLKNAEIDVTENPHTATPKKEFSYLLQAGSFKYREDADKLRIELLLLNLNAEVEAVTLSSGEAWHRVLVGPLANRSNVAAARAKLAENKIDSLLLEREI